MNRPALETQNLTKSCNEALILGVLRRGPRHGYQLALDIENDSQGYFKFNHGTLYPILHKLEKEGLIAGKWSNEGSRGRRKAYELTKDGQTMSQKQRQAWQGFSASLSAVINGEKP